MIYDFNFKILICLIILSLILVVLCKKIFNKNFKEIIGKLEKNGLIEHSILVSNSSQEREEVYTNLRDLNLEEKISYFSTILVNKEVKKEVKVG